jgi:hydroxyacylglutathione hydrolase
MAGEVASLLFSRMTVPILYFLDKRWEGHLFTGDTLFVGDSGRTDLKGGHRPTLGASIRRLMRLPEETIVWPGHDYGPTPSSTLGWEKRHNVNAREYGYHIPS